MAPNRRVRRLSWPSRNQPEDGFTLVEVLVALGVMFMALVVLAYTMLSSLAAVGFSRQRTEATALANQALEQIRALPSSQMFMSTADVAGDVQLVSCGPATCFNTRTVPTADFGANPAIGPLTPHISHAHALPGNTDYTIKSYLTYDPADVNMHTLVATVQVSWSNAQKGGVAASLQVESKVYNNQFNEAPPGIHTFTANAQGQPGVVQVTGTLLNQQAVNATFNLPSTSAAMKGTSLPNSTDVGATAGPVSAGIAQSSVTAGPANTPVMNTPAATQSAQSPAGSATTDGPRTTSSTPTVLTTFPGSVSGNLGNLMGTVSGGATEAASAVAASAANGGAGTPGSPALPANGLGFGQGSASQTGAVAANLSLPNPVPILPSLLTIGLVNIVPTGNSTPDLSTVHQDGTAASPQAQTFSASANQSFSEIDIVNMAVAGVPLPTLLKLTSFNKSASVAAGTASCPTPTFTNSGSISVLGGQPVRVSDLLSGFVPLSTVNSALIGANVPLGGLTTLAVTGTGITLGSNPIPGSCSMTVGTPIIVNLTVDASILGQSLLHVNIVVNLGSVHADAHYS